MVRRRFLARMPIWVQDWLGSMRVQAMTAEQEGGLFRLCLLQWQEGGLPDDDMALLRLARVLGPPEQHRILLDAFQRCSDGARRCDKVNRVRESEEEYLDRQSEKGRRGNDVRWGSHRDRTGIAQGSHRDRRGDTPGIPVGSPPDSGLRTPDLTPLPPKGGKGSSTATWETALADPEFDRLRADPAWMQAWGEWIEHARSGAKAKVPKAPRAKQVFRDALRVGTALHVAAIRASIRNDWQGIDPSWVKPGTLDFEAAKAASDAAREREDDLATARRRAELLAKDIPVMESGSQDGRRLIQQWRQDGQTDAEVIAALKAHVDQARRA